MAVSEGKKENFTDLVSEGKVLVDFNADWCGPCQMLKPMIEEFAEKHGEIKVVSVNIDEEEELAEKYRVSGIPCLILFEDGEETKREVGLIPLKKIEKMAGV